MSDRKVSIFIDGLQCEEVAVDTGFLQGSSVSPTFFVIYFRGVFKEVEK